MRHHEQVRIWLLKCNRRLPLTGVWVTIQHHWILTQMKSLDFCENYNSDRYPFIRNGDNFLLSHSALLRQVTYALTFVFSNISLGDNYLHSQWTGRQTLDSQHIRLCIDRTFRLRLFIFKFICNTVWCKTAKRPLFVDWISPFRSQFAFSSSFRWKCDYRLMWPAHVPFVDCTFRNKWVNGHLSLVRDWRLSLLCVLMHYYYQAHRKETSAAPCQLFIFHWANGKWKKRKCCATIGMSKHLSRTYTGSWATRINTDWYIVHRPLSAVCIYSIEKISPLNWEQTDRTIYQRLSITFYFFFFNYLTVDKR